MPVGVVSFVKDRRKIPVLLALLFLVSVLARVPFLDRPLSTRHEWLTSTSLIHIRAFYEQGFRPLYFSPSLTYASPADKNIGFHWNLRDSAGNIYYCSFPPFAFIFPAFFFRLFGVYPSVLGLQVFNLFFHLVSCVFVYLILMRLTGGNKGRNGADRFPALLGFAVYLFSPSALWFQSNVYMSDMFVQPFFIMGIWLFLKSGEKGEKSWVYELLFALDLFAFVYTEWMGVFFAATAFILTIAGFRGNGAWKTLRRLMAIGLATLAPLALTVWQYSLISGFPALLEYLRGKFLFRTGDPRYASGGQSFLNIVSWLNIAVNYIGGFLPFIVIAVLLAVRKKKTVKSVKRENSPETAAAVALTAVPVILHHLVFFNFTTVHDFSALKGGVFIAIITGLLYHQSRTGKAPGEVPAKKEWIAVAAAVCFALLQFYLIDGYGAHGRYRKIGETIRNTSSTNEVIFVDGLGSSPDPQYLVYAQRDLEPWDGLEKARLLMRTNGVVSGVLYRWNADKAELGSMVRFGIKDRALPGSVK